MFLRREKGEYYLYLLGKNGETRPQTNVQLQVVHKAMVQDSEQTYYCNTGKEGRVKLGKLKRVVGLRAKCKLYDLEQQWILNDDRQSLSYPAAIDVVESEPVEFPVLFQNKSRRTVALIRKSGDGATVLEDLFERVEFVKQDGLEFNVVRVSGLQEGQYVLDMKKAGKKVVITVHKGQYWENDQFILKRNCLFENHAA